MEKTWQQKDGRWYYGDRLIENPAGYGAVCRARFLSEERRKDDRRPIHFSLDRPIPAEYNKPLPDSCLSGERRVNAWGMPIADDQPLNGLEFYKSRVAEYVYYTKEYLGLSKDRVAWMYYTLELLYRSVKECREQGPDAVRRCFSKLSGIDIEKGRCAKLVALLHHIAASPGWFAISREGREFFTALYENRDSEHLWKHPRWDNLRRGFLSFVPKRAHCRKKK